MEVGDRFKRVFCSRIIVVCGKPRAIAGGKVVLITWEEDNLAQLLPDGTVHPAWKKGFMWEEPVCNLIKL